MDILNKIERLLGDQAMTAGSGATTTANVAINTAKGHIDVVGGQCPKGQRYDTKKKVCVPITDESSIVGGSYIANTTVNIIGSGQTRTWGVKRGDGPQRGGTRGEIEDLDRKNKVDVENADKTIENLGRRGLKFNHILGAYVPDQWIENRYPIPKSGREEGQDGYSR